MHIYTTLPDLLKNQWQRNPLQQSCLKSTAAHNTVWLHKLSEAPKHTLTDGFNTYELDYLKCTRKIRRTVIAPQNLCNFKLMLPIVHHLIMYPLEEQANDKTLGRTSFRDALGKTCPGNLVLVNGELLCNKTSLSQGSPVG